MGRDCGTQPSSPPAEAAHVAPMPAPPAAPTPKPDLFVSSVRPVLSTRCAPCHEPGGKMYDRLPFDRAEVVADHRAGVLRRIREAEEKSAVERWLAERDAANPAAVKD